MTPWTVCTPPGSSVHGSFPGMEWAAMLSSRGSSWTRYRTHIYWVSCTGTRLFTTEPRKPILLALTLNQQKCVMWTPQAKGCNNCINYSIKYKLKAGRLPLCFTLARPQWCVLGHQDRATRGAGRQRSGNRALSTPEDQIWLIHPGKKKFRGTSVFKCEKPATWKRS